MADLKTKPTKNSVSSFLNSIEDEQKRKDCKKIASIMKKATACSPKMWGPSIVGYGTYHYKYASGRQGDWFLVGFSPRKQNITIYLMAGVEKAKSQLNKLGKYKTGKACLYVNKLEDVDIEILTEIIENAVKTLSRLNKQRAS